MWGKVKALQRLLTRSFSGKMLAVKRVTENRGKRTPGVDGKIWSTPVAKSTGAHIPQRNASSDAFNYVGGDYTFNGNRTIHLKRGEFCLFVILHTWPHVINAFLMTLCQRARYDSVCQRTPLIFSS